MHFYMIRIKKPSKSDDDSCMIVISNGVVFNVIYLRRKLPIKNNYSAAKEEYLFGVVNRLI